MTMEHIQTPLDEGRCRSLRVGDQVLLSGVIYTARDKAHQKLVEMLDQGQALPLDLRNQVIYYAGPTPAPPGEVIGAVGPTTSGRMDAFSPRLLKECGLRGMIGKGPRDRHVREAMQEAGAVYFAAVGGAGALISERIKKVDVIAFEELGTEAIRRLEVESFPLIVACDAHGGNIFESGPENYRVD